MMQIAAELLRGVQDLLLPARCHICHQVIQADQGQPHICPDCYSRLPLLKSPFCSCCGIPFTAPEPDHLCGSCIKKPPPYLAARGALCYEGACREMIHNFKYNGKSHLRRPLALLTAQLLEPFVKEQQPDLLLPVPLHISRLRSRGYNQSLLLTRLLAKQWNLPFARQALQRTRPTRPQVELNRNERLKNLENAFNVSEPEKVKKQHVMLVDDVFTTGSTLTACAKVLLAAGAATVTAVTVAHAP